MNLPEFFAQGARLDALAARYARFLAQEYPDFAPGLEAARVDEERHSRVLSGLSEGLWVPSTYARGYALELDGGPTHAALVLNLVERNSVRQFRVAARATGLKALADIARDEARHVLLGRQLLQAIRPSQAAIKRAVLAVRLNEGYVGEGLHEGVYRFLDLSERDLKESLR